MKTWRDHLQAPELVASPPGGKINPELQSGGEIVKCIDPTIEEQLLGTVLVHFGGEEKKESTLFFFFFFPFFFLSFFFQFTTREDSKINLRRNLSPRATETELDGGKDPKRWRFFEIKFFKNKE